jgi:hypothetical protein
MRGRGYRSNLLGASEADDHPPNSQNFTAIPVNACALYRRDLVWANFGAVGLSPTSMPGTAIRCGSMPTTVRRKSCAWNSTTSDAICVPQPAMGHSFSMIQQIGSTDLRPNGDCAITGNGSVLESPQNHGVQSAPWQFTKSTHTSGTETDCCF